MRWSRRWAATGLGAAVVITAGTVTAVATTSGSHPAGRSAVAVQMLPGHQAMISIVYAGTDATAAASNAALRAAGVKNTTVCVTAAAPSLVGHWTGVGSDGRTPEAEVNRILQQIRTAGTGPITVPTNTPGQLNFQIGRAARPGETVGVLPAR